jgi:hypothetical protein
MSLKSLLSEARRKKQLQAPEGVSSFNFDNAFSETCPNDMWELSDVFSYSESFFFPKWREARGGRLAVEDVGKRDTLESLLRVLMDNQQDATLLRFFEPIVEQVAAGLNVYELSLSLNVLSFLMLRFPTSEELRESVRRSCAVDVMLKFVVQFADGGDATVPVKKVMLVLWRAAGLGMGWGADIDARKAALVAAHREPGPKSRQCDVDDMRKRTERVQWTLGGGTAPAALHEALQVLEQCLHIPAAALRENGGRMDSRLIRKVVGYELRVAREYGSPATVPGEPRPSRRVNVVAVSSALPFEAFYRRTLPRLAEYVLCIIKVCPFFLLSLAHSNCATGACGSGGRDEIVGHYGGDSVRFAQRRARRTDSGRCGATAGNTGKVRL